MKPVQKVVWSEGLFLTPQHFQQWDRYTEGLVHFRVMGLQANGWGFTELEWDADALLNGVFSLRRAAGVLPDGLVFQMPETDPLPEGRPVEAFFPTSMERLDVFLAIPMEREGRRNVDLDGGGRSDGRTRYARDFLSVVDDATGQNEKSVGVARKQFRIVFSGESLDEQSVIKVAELVRSASGQVTAREDFIPPCLRIAASPALGRLTRQVLEMLSAKSRALAEERRRQRSGAVEFAATDISNFWFLHTVNSFIPLLAHASRSGSLHPENLYLGLCQLAGELITFSPEGHPEDLPPYQHESLDRVFGRLFETLRGFLEIVLSSRAVSIPLERTEPTLFVGRITDDRLLEAGQFFLGVSAQIPESDLITRVPLQLKIGSLDKIQILVGAGMPGLPLRHAQRPPSDIRTHLGFQYFQMETLGEYWEIVKQAKNIAVYVPSDFTDVKLELVALRP